MKSFLVIGLGRFGTAVAEELSALGQEVLALDVDEENVQRIADHVTQAIQGDAQEEAVLRSVGARNFDCCVVAVGADMEASILITVMLKEMGVKRIVAKAMTPIHARVLERVGADRVVLPEIDMGQRLAQRWREPMWWTISVCPMSSPFWRSIPQKAGSGIRSASWACERRIRSTGWRSAMARADR